MIKVNLSNTSGVTQTEIVTQWDFGQVLEITGLDTQEDVEIHFANHGENQALVAMSKYEDGKWTVEIPDVLLQKGTDVFVFVYEGNETEGRTIRKARIPIARRAKPFTDIPESEQEPFLQSIRQIMSETKEIAQSVRDDADNREFDGALIINYETPDSKQLIESYNLNRFIVCRKDDMYLRVKKVTTEEADDTIDFETGEPVKYYTFMFGGMADNNYYEVVFKTKTNTWSSSSRQYTTPDDVKQAIQDSGVEENVQSDWNVTDDKSDAFIKNKIPVKNGAGKNSIIIGEGNAEGDFSFTGGTTDTTIAKQMLGSIVGTLIGTPDAAYGKGVMSFAYGAGVKALTAGTMAVGVNSIAGVLGFYWHSIDFTTTDSEGNVTPTIVLSTEQKPFYQTSATILGNTITTDWNKSATWTDEAANVLANWAVGDVISIVNDHKYAFCSTIKTIDSTNGKITVDSLPFTESTASADTVLAKNFDDYTIFVPEKPTIGIVNLGFGSFALGYNNKATGSFATTIGYENIAGSDFAFVAGRENKGSYASLVGGRKNTATGNNAFIAGEGNSVSGIHGAATGYKTVASGRCANAQNNTTTASGNDSSAEGWGTEAIGVQSHAGGAKTRTIGARSFASGYRTIALGEDSFAMGIGTTVMEEIPIDLSTASNDEIISQWENTKFSLAKGIRSQVLGADNLTLGNHAFAHGAYNIAAGNHSHAGGYSNKVYSHCTHVEGHTNTVGFKNDTDSRTVGAMSHVEGRENKIIAGNYVHVEGRGNIGNTEYQHIQGKYNEEDTENKYAHIIGGGTSDTDRKNIHTVDWDGNAEYAGTVETTAIILKSSTEGSEKRFKVTVDDSGTLSVIEVTGQI